MLQKFKLLSSAWTHNCSFAGWAIVVITPFLLAKQTLNTQSSQWSSVISFSYLYSSISTRLEVPEHGEPDWVHVGVM